MNKLSPDFLLELFKGCLRSKTILEASVVHLKYTFLPEERYKKLWKEISEYYGLHGILPTFGVLSQIFSSDQNVKDLLVKIKDIEPPTQHLLLKQFEEFIKDSMIVEFYYKLGDTYNTGEKERAQQLIKEFSQQIGNFTLSNNQFKTVFKGFAEQQQERTLNFISTEAGVRKIPFGIDETDYYCHGGMDPGDTALFLAQSGVGKTKLLRHIAVTAARLGFRVLHIQGEDSEINCTKGFAATWTRLPLKQIESGNISEKVIQDLTKRANDIHSLGGEIYIKAFEQFDTASAKDIRQAIIDAEKAYGKIDLVTIDYFELFDPGDGKKYSTVNDGERARRRSLGKKFKNIAIEFKVALVTATQASSVDPEKLKDPAFVMTRYNVSEFKAVIDPFSFFISLNQTLDERAQGIMRLHNDKIRNYKSGQTYKIYQHYDTDTFYDTIRTRAIFFTKK